MRWILDRREERQRFDPFISAVWRMDRSRQSLQSVGSTLRDCREIVKIRLDSSRIWSSSKTYLQRVDDYDSDLDDEGSETAIATDGHARSAW